MDSEPPPRQQRLTELPRKLTALAAETAQTKDDMRDPSPLRSVEPGFSSLSFTQTA